MSNYLNAKSALLHCFIGFCTIALTSCSPTNTNLETKSENSNYLSRIKLANIGEVFLRLDVNNMQNVSVVEADEELSRIALPANLLNAGENTVTLQFFVTMDADTEIILAESTQIFNIDTFGDTVSLQGVQYAYPDEDADLVPNIRELLIFPLDLDNDGIDNYNDKDSDNDGVFDNLDSDPYPGSQQIGVINVQENIAVQLLDGTQYSLPIGVINGNPTLLELLAEAVTPLPVLIPPSWPWADFPISQPSGSWNYIGLPLPSSALCVREEIDIDFDTSSIRSNVSAPVLGYFKTFVGQGFFAMLGKGDVIDLANHTGSNLLMGGSSFDNALQAIFIPPSTTGYISLWTRENFTGRHCQLNLTSPAPFKE